MKTTIAARLLPILALFALTTFGQQASAQAAEDGWTITELANYPVYTEGSHFELLDPPQPTSGDDSSVEVMVFFIYGCGHCASLEPALNRWVAQAPDNVHFVRMPVASWNQTAEIHARIFWTLRYLRRTGTITDTEREAIHADVFEAIHVRGNRMLRQDDIRAFFAGVGIDSGEFDAAWNSSPGSDDGSFAARSAAMATVEHNLDQNRYQPRVYGVERTPTIVINGKYRTNLVMAGDDIFNVMDYLIEREVAR